MEASSRDLIRDLFRRRALSRTPFMPLVSSFAARLEQISVREMLTDPALLSRSLHGAQQLFGYDAVTTVVDPSLEAEACGCQIDWGTGEQPPQVVSHPLEDGLAVGELDLSGIEGKGRIPMVLESTKRLRILLGKETALIGVVNGPIRLAGHLKGGVPMDKPQGASEELGSLVKVAGRAILALSRAYCELGVDAILVVEDQVGQAHPDLLRMLAAQLQSIRNVAQFYRASLVLQLNGCAPDRVESVFRLPFDAVILSGADEDERVSSTAAARNSCLGLGLPTSFFSEAEDSGDVTEQAIGWVLRANATKGLFISTAEEIPYGGSVASVHAIVKRLKST